MKIRMKKVKKILLVLVLCLSVSSAFAVEWEKLEGHGGIYTSYSTYKSFGPIMILEITYVCNDGTVITESDWWWK